NSRTSAATVSKQPPAPHYDLVQTLEQLDNWIERALAQGMVAVDTETTSLDQTRARLVGISLCLHPGEACYIPLGHVTPGSRTVPDLLSHADSAPPGPTQIALAAALDRL